MTRVEDRKIGGRFSGFEAGFGPQNLGRIPAGIGAECPRRSEDSWRDHEACIEAKESREVAGSVRCSEKKLDENALMRIIDLIIVVGVF